MASRRPDTARTNRSVQVDGAKVREARLALGLSQAALSEHTMGTPHMLSPVSVKRAELGEPIYASTAACLANALGVPLASILPVGGPGLPDDGAHPAVAVLAFRGQPDDTVFADGLADDLITRLSCWWFPVIARTSTLGTMAPEPAARARELGIGYWIEGGIRRSGSRLLVSARLVDAPSQRVISSQAYELTTAILNDLSPRLLDAQVTRIEGRDPTDLSAWQQALLGAWHFYHRTPTDNATARDLLAGALKRERHLPIAWFALALTYQQDIVNQWTTDPAAALTSLARVSEEFSGLYPSEASAHIVSAYLDVYLGRRDSAMSHLTEAIDIDPNASLAYGLYGQTLAMAGKADPALEQLEIALRLSPRDSERWTVHTSIALAHFVAARYEETVRAAHEATRIRPGMAFPYAVMASAHAHLGNRTDAKTALAGMVGVDSKTTLQGLRGIMASTAPEIGARFLDGIARAGLALR
jgi:adenylate cyclase